MVPIDAMLIQQVLINLLENALRYTSAGSPLEIEATRANNQVILEVRDRGPGIGREDAERLFERFYRGSAQPSRDGGAGLGLTICRAIMQAHGGTIALEKPHSRRSDRPNHAAAGEPRRMNLRLGS